MPSFAELFAGKYKHERRAEVEIDQAIDE